MPEQVALPHLLEIAMYIVVIAWLYVVLLMAILESSWIAGLMTLLVYGIVPLAILIYVTGTPQRWRRQKHLHVADQPVSDSNRQDSKGDEHTLHQGIPKTDLFVQTGNEIRHRDINHAGGSEGQEVRHSPTDR